MDPKTRINLAKEVITALDSEDYGIQDLILTSCGLPELNRDVLGSRYEEIQRRVRSLNDAKLVKVAEAIGITNAGKTYEDSSSAAAQDTDKLTVFASHAHQDRERVGAVSNELEQFGVKLFVAHDSIAVNAEWMDAIEGELDSCHAGVAFVSPNFNQSAFCQQEVGWLLGLKKPILRMMLGDSPKALLGHKQAAKLKPKATSKEIAEIVLDLFGKEQSLSTQLINSLCFTAKRSSSFAQTDKIFENIPSSTVLTKHQAEHLLDAAELNNQVYWAQVPHTGGKTYRDLIADLIERSLDAASFADRIAELRRQATNDSMIQR